MSDEPVVVVRGEAFDEVDPEIATFSVTVSGRDRSRDEVLRRLAERQDWVRQVLDRYAAAVEKRSTAGVHVYPEMKGKAGEKVVAHVGQVTTTVTVTDFAVLSELILALAGQEQVSVAGPWWSLRPGSTVHREVRHQAIRAAIARAQEYVEVLDARLLGLERLADEGSSGAEPVYRQAVALSYGKSGPDAPPLDLEPQRQRVHATVEARFRISPPGVLATPTS